MDIDRNVCPSLIGRPLRRWRRLNDIKQSTVAEALGVSQTTISRWESRTSQPTAKEQDRLYRLLGARPTSAADRALLDLVSKAAEPMHLVCDMSHRLLAASPGRLATMRHGLIRLQGVSLWRFASAGIARAEQRLPELGWYDSLSAEMEVETEFHDSPALWIEAGTIIWTRIPLTNGTVARLVRDGRNTSPTGA